MTLCRQPDVRTIEGTLFSALVAAGAVSKDNADDPVKVRSKLQLNVLCFFISLLTTSNSRS